jgi:hypothetical protein
VDCGRRKHKAHRPLPLTRYFPEDGNESQIQWSGYVQPGVMRDAGRPTTLQLNFAVLLLGFLSEVLLAPADGPWYIERDNVVIVEKLYIIRYTNNGL